MTKALIGLLGLLICVVVGPASAARSGEASPYLFADVADRVGVGQWTRTWGSAWSDYDADGDADFLLGRHASTPWLFRHRDEGTTYARVRVGDFDQFMDRHQCAWGEANGDVSPDLYCVQGADQGIGAGPNQLFIQTKDGFENRARRYGVTDPLGRGRTANWLDYDSDGDLDIFVGNAHRSGHPNVLYRNTGDGFDRVRAGLGDELDTTSSSWADWDDDGDPDLLVLQDGGRAVTYENQGGRFARVMVPGITGRRGRSGAWGDYDGDGLPDLHLMQYGRSFVLRNLGGAFDVVHRERAPTGRASTWLDVENDGDLDLFVVRGADKGGESVNRGDFMIVMTGGDFQKVRGTSFRGPRSGNGDSVASADYDNDGRVDVFVLNGFGRTSGKNVLLRNKSQGGNGAALYLRGGSGNPMGFGATVHVRTPTLEYSRPITDAANARSQSTAGYVHLGLGDDALAQVRVVWPDGVEDCTEASAGEVVVMARGSSPCGLSRSARPTGKGTRPLAVFRRTG